MKYSCQRKGVSLDTTADPSIRLSSTTLSANFTRVFVKCIKQLASMTCMDAHKSVGPDVDVSVLQINSGKN